MQSLFFFFKQTFLERKVATGNGSLCPEEFPNDEIPGWTEIEAGVRPTAARAGRQLRVTQSSAPSPSKSPLGWGAQFCDPRCGPCVGARCVQPQLVLELARRAGQGGGM